MNLESKARINSLISAANATTSKTDTDLTSAVGALIAGFGQGGGSGGGASGIYMAKITPAEDYDSLEITHNLGTTDILLAACFVETVSNAEKNMSNKAVAKFWAKTDIPVRLTSSSTTEDYECHFTFNYNSGDYKTGTGASPNNEAYKSEVVDNNTFKFASAGAASAKYYTGFTYTVIIMAASVFKETEG